MISVAIYSDLGNRISPLCSAIALARERDTRLQIFWEIGGEHAGRNEFRCYFENLFHMSDGAAKIINGKPRGFKTIIGRKMHETMKCSLHDVCEEEGVCIRLPYPFHGKWKDEARRLESIPFLKGKIEEIASRFVNTIGVHIRRTDNIQSIKRSPTWAFYKAMDEEIDSDKNIDFFLATDDANEERSAIERYGKRIIAYPKRSRARNCTEGIQDALVDLYCLSRTKRIIGSHYSTFSNMASVFTGIPVRWICVESK